MARYNREFLVPYLQNICALHMADMRMGQRCEYLHSTAQGYRRGEYNPKPEYPDHQSIGVGTVVLLGLGVFFLYPLITLSADDAPAGLVAVYFILSAVFLGFGIWNIISVRSSNRAAECEYSEKMYVYEQKKKHNSDLMKKAGSVEGELRGWTKERDRIQNLLQKAYGANVIPNQYRNIYAAIYLYEWFRSSGADDLEHALSMFVLEEIKDRLDTVIRNQSDVILNQQIMIANQYKSLEQQQNLESTMRAKLDSIEANQEQQLCYTRMIESNTATTAYFAASEYIRRI